MNDSRNIITVKGGQGSKKILASFLCQLFIKSEGCMEVGHSLLLLLLRMRIYVASKWARRELTRDIMAVLVTLGHTIAYDWTHHKETKSSEKEYADEAAADVAGIRSADLFIADMDDPAYPYRGTFFEMGVAVGANIPVVIVTPYVTFDPKNVAFHSNCFTTLPSILRVRTFTEALEVHAL